MAEPILFVDAEQVLADWLRAELVARGTNVPVSTRVPTSRPAQFVRILRTGGARHSLVTDAAQITVESWATSEPAAASLAQLVRALLGSAPGRVAAVVVYRVTEFSGPANSPDPETETPRYVQTFEIHLRGAAA